MVQLGVSFPNNPKSPWFLKFLDNYESILKASKTLTTSSLVSVVFDNRCIMGYIVGVSFNQTATTPNLVQAQLTFAVVSYEILATRNEIGVFYPLEREVEPEPDSGDWKRNVLKSTAKYLAGYQMEKQGLSGMAQLIGKQAGEL